MGNCRCNFNETLTFRALRQITGAEIGGATVAINTPECAVSGTYSVNPSYSNLKPTSNWEFYIDGVAQGAYGQVPFGWNTMSDADGMHSLMVAAYTQEGSVWPSNVATVRVNNSAEPVTVNALSTNASSYIAGSKVTVSATLCSRVPITVQQLAIAVRIKSTGENYDFPTKFNNHSFGTSPQTVTTSSVFNKSGTYVYWVAYYKDGVWHSLTPKKEFTIN